MSQKQWTGPAPERCDICRGAIADKFYDARIPSVGSWGHMCPRCFVSTGALLGTGRGQRYERRESPNDGAIWAKTGG